MNPLLTVKHILDRVLDFLVMSVFATLICVVVWQVFTRYILANPSDWTEEMATFLMIWIGLLGACVGLRLRAHLGIDFFVNRMSPDKQFAAEIFGYLMIALFSASVLLGGGFRLVHQVWINGQNSPAMGIPMAAVYAALPVSGFFLTLYSLALISEAIARRRQGQKPDSPPDSGDERKPTANELRTL